MSIFEAIMLICFGASWPAAICKTWTSRNPAGKSILFLSLVIIGYVAGSLNKIYGTFDWVFYLYVVNTLMVLMDLVLTLHFRRRIARGKNTGTAKNSVPEKAGN